ALGPWQAGAPAPGAGNAAIADPATAFAALLARSGALGPRFPDRRFKYVQRLVHHVVLDRDGREKPDDIAVNAAGQQDQALLKRLEAYGIGKVCRGQVLPWIVERSEERRVGKE